MCRHFLSTPLAPGLVDSLLDLATRAPSAGHAQGWAWLVLDSEADRRRFWAATSDPARVPPGLAPAPVVVVPLFSRDLYRARYAQADKVAFEWDVPYWLVDTAMATMLVLLGAHDAGLGALLFRLHRPAADLRREFGVPAGWDPLGALALGWPDPAAHPRAAGSPERPRRRPLSEVVHRGGW